MSGESSSVFLFTKEQTPVDSITTGWFTDLPLGTGSCLFLSNSHPRLVNPHVRCVCEGSHVNPGGRQTEALPAARAWPRLRDGAGARVACAVPLVRCQPQPAAASECKTPRVTRGRCEEPSGAAEHQSKLCLESVINL